MKKGYKHTDLSNKVCAHHECSKRLKMRLVNKREPQNIQLCYKHYAAIKSHEVPHRTIMKMAADHKRRHP